MPRPLPTKIFSSLLRLGTGKLEIPDISDSILELLSGKTYAFTTIETTIATTISHDISLGIIFNLHDPNFCIRNAYG